MLRRCGPHAGGAHLNKGNLLGAGRRLPYDSADQGGGEAAENGP